MDGPNFETSTTQQRVDKTAEQFTRALLEQIKEPEAAILEVVLKTIIRRHFPLSEVGSTEYKSTGTFLKVVSKYQYRDTFLKTISVFSVFCYHLSIEK